MVKVRARARARVKLRLTLSKKALRAYVRPSVAAYLVKVRGGSRLGGLGLGLGLG